MSCHQPPTMGVFAFSHPLSPLPLCLLPLSTTSLTPAVSKPGHTHPHSHHRTAIPPIESWHLSGDVFQQWEAEVDLCFGSSTRRTGPPGMPWWDCSATTAMGWAGSEDCEVEHPKNYSRQNTCLFVNKDDAHWAFPQCQVLPVILSIFTPHIR